MFEFLILGLFIGMAHALEADHLAAVGTLTSSGKATPKRLVFLGASWGLGHTTTLLLISMPVILFGFVLSEQLAAGMEFFIGVMLVILGLHALWKMYHKRIHFHLHDHGDGQQHFHAHSHEGAKTSHVKDTHDHTHARFSLRAYLIGLAHGAAGSAGLVALAAASHDAITALAYITVFGFGSILGMAALTYTASWPLRVAEKSAARLLRFAQIAVAGMAIFIGARVMTQTATIIMGIV